MRSLVRALVMFHYDRQAEQIQRQYDAFLTLIDKAVPHIWLDEDTDQEFRPVSKVKRIFCIQCLSVLYEGTERFFVKRKEFKTVLTS